MNHSSHLQKHSKVKHDKISADSRHSATNIPTLRNGNTSPVCNNSQGEASLMGSPNGIDLPPDVSANTQQTGQNIRDSGLSSPQKRREKRKHCDSANGNRHKSKKHKQSSDARFDGHRISHLVKKRTYNKEETEDKSENQKESDDYVLAKLFKKSGRLVH